jgi:ERCC4-type nuclease
MSWTIDIHEDAWFALHLNGSHEALPEGDFKYESNNGVALVERKTWSDAYNSWRSKRLEDQLSRMLMREDISDSSQVILLIEGRKETLFGGFANRKAGEAQKQAENLQAFFNRISAEICPVVYTSGQSGTLRYLNALATRLNSGEFGSLVRKPTVVSSTRNQSHAFLETIPGIGRTTAKKIAAHYDSFTEFFEDLNSFSLEHPEESDPDYMKSFLWKLGPSKVTSLKKFLTAEENWSGNQSNASRQVLKTIGGGN